MSVISQNAFIPARQEGLGYAPVVPPPPYGSPLWFRIMKI